MYKKGDNFVMPCGIGDKFYRIVGNEIHESTVEVVLIEEDSVSVGFFDEYEGLIEYDISEVYLTEYEARISAMKKFAYRLEVIKQ